MIYIGMIFQYNKTEGNGLLMLTDGEKKEFSKSSWIDSENEPTVGQKISYKVTQNTPKIRVATADDLEHALLSEEEQNALEGETQNSSQELEILSVDGYIEHFMQNGYKLVKDTQSDLSRDVTLRMYTPENYGEVTISEQASQVSLTHVLNGQTVLKI